jgi:hypothetical protein
LLSFFFWWTFRLSWKDLLKPQTFRDAGEGKNGSFYKIDYVSFLPAVHMSATTKSNLQINSADILSAGEKPMFFCTLWSKAVKWKQLYFIHKNTHQAGFRKDSQSQNSEEKIFCNKKWYFFFCLNLESSISYFKQARDCKLQSVWIKRIYINVLFKPKRERKFKYTVNERYMPNFKTASAQKRKNNLTFC